MASFRALVADRVRGSTSTFARLRRQSARERQMTLAVHRLPVTEINWSQIDSFNDRNVFQTREWIEFIASTLGAEPVICALKDRNATVGYFTGLITRRYGIPILGSPMRGWSTWYMGFNLLEGVPRSDALRALIPYAFNSLD